MLSIIPAAAKIPNDMLALEAIDATAAAGIKPSTRSLNIADMIDSTLSAERRAVKAAGRKVWF